MSLNPIQFGEHVVEQFQRYLLTYFPIADAEMEAQVREHLKRRPGGERKLVKGPFIHLNQPFEPGPMLADLQQELGLHPALPGLFRFDQLYKHQELATRAILEGRHTVMATATGSGKTEGFLLPILDHCLRMRDENAPPGMVAALVYPMNALVNDQMDRLRLMLAGTGITFARYTGETPFYNPDNIPHLSQSRAYTAEELRARREENADLPRPWEEAISREEIRERQPRLLLTNYRQLEFMLLRDRDLDLLRDAPLQFMVFDEVHTYTGALGSEVACLIRRLRHVAGKQPDEVISIGTSATVQDDESGLDGAELTKEFTHRLFGVPQDNIEIVTEQYREAQEPPGEIHTPPRPVNAQAMLDEVLEAAREVQLQDEVTEVPAELLAVAERLCGREAPEGAGIDDRLHRLLATNEIVHNLSRSVTRPLSLEDLLNRLRQVGDRQDASEEELTAEALAYLTLGAICQHDDEPLLRPKVHYFVQGYPGLWVSFEPEDPHADVASELKPVVHFETQRREEDSSLGMRLPLMLCRGCGQYYLRAVAQEAWAAQGDNAYMPIRAADPWEQPSEGEFECYLTNRLHTQDEDFPGDAEVWHMCRYCGALHREAAQACQRDSCGRAGPMVPMQVFRGELRSCAACGAVGTVSGTRSAEVADVHALAETMLSAMPEPSLRKLLVFSDNRQEAAFQAGWMRERSRRHEFRHMLHQLLDEEPETPRTLDRLTEQMLDRAQQERLVEIGSHGDLENAQKKIKWFLLQEFASRAERRGSLETLGLAEVAYEGLAVDADEEFFGRWADTFGVEPADVVNIVRTLLDYYRRRGMLSDKLMQHWWEYRDPEVRSGLVSVRDYWSPKVLTRTKCEPERVTTGLLSERGQTSAQGLVRKGIARGEGQTDDFLAELWEWLQDDAQGYLEQVHITQRRSGRPQRIRIDQTPCQVNVHKMTVRPAAGRYVCDVCQSVQSVRMATGACPEYRCDGHVHEASADGDHYAVVRYTEEDFVPLRPVEHSGQVGKAEREEIESEFKKEDGGYNCVVCTPTLELGVDIGQLEMALMRNVPPTPANYAQRAGRAGRRHRIAVVMDYCGSSPHDRYYFTDPEQMIAGRIRVPAFSMRNEPLIRKHVHSGILTALRGLPVEERGEVLQEAFPRYIWRYFASADGEGKPSNAFLSAAPKFPSLHDLVETNSDLIRDELLETFTAAWPEDQADHVAAERLDRFIDNMPGWLERHVEVLFDQVKNYRDKRNALSQKEIEGEELTDREIRERDRYNFAIRTLKREEQETYTLTYLSEDGYFPGYALSREACVARCLQPYTEIWRPEPLALREFTPTNWIYAAGDVYGVSRVDFFGFSPGSQDISRDVQRREMVYDAQHDRVIDPASSDTEGQQGEEFSSFRLGAVELRQRQQIDDSRERRHYGAHDIVGTFLGWHRGGEAGKVSEIDWRLYRQAELRLVNLGPIGRQRDNREIGFPICSVCGAVRNPHASQAEIAKFEEYHKEACGAHSVHWAALHVDFTSDLLMLGPFEEHIDAVNLMEAVLAGGRELLDMGETELEGFVEVREDNQPWILIYDPMPGGSGFLQQLRRLWSGVCSRALDVLTACDCDDACYGCLKTYWNQRHHSVLSRQRAVELLKEHGGEMRSGSPMPPNFAEPSPQDVQEESNAEARFTEILSERHFPLPEEKQYRVQLSDGTVTVADFGYPDERVLVYIDGMSEGIHGGPAQQRADRITRLKLRNEGYQVVERTAEGLFDQQAVNSMVEELAVYLGREDLLSEH